MRIKLTYIAPLLAAGAAAVAIAAAPTAAAAKCAELLGKNLPVARQCSDQRRPSPRSVLSLRRSHAVSARRPRRPYGLTPKVAAAIGPPPWGSRWPRFAAWKDAPSLARRVSCSACSPRLRRLRTSRDTSWPIHTSAATLVL